MAPEINRLSNISDVRKIVAEFTHGAVSVVLYSHIKPGTIPFPTDKSSNFIACYSYGREYPKPVIHIGKRFFTFPEYGRWRVITHELGHHFIRKVRSCAKRELWASVYGIKLLQRLGLTYAAEYEHYNVRSWKNSKKPRFKTMSGQFSGLFPTLESLLSYDMNEHLITKI